MNEDTYPAEKAWVKGIIIGVAKSGTSLLEEITEKDSTNIAIAADATSASFVPVQLPATSEIRAELNLSQNPENLGKEIKIFGQITKYFGVTGIKEPEKYDFITEDYVLGDVNGDGAVDVSDYIGVANDILGIEQSTFNKEAADVDKSGVIDVTDYLGVGNIIHTGSPFGNTDASRAAKKAATNPEDVDNVIYVESFQVEPGTTEATLSVQMKNTAEIRGFQFDLYLPEGVSVTVNAKGKIQGAALNENRLPEDDEHSLTSSKQADGAVRFLCGSQYQETFTGNSGELMTINVKLDEGMANGEYTIAIKNQKLSENDITKSYETELVESILTVGVPTGISQLTVANQNAQEEIYDLQGRRVQNATKGLYIRNGKKVVVK
jgi:hypothetical protein